ncbi:tetratricopeptide repeat protein 12 isoform X2 [Melanerpes formicivorus]|uniref:tetratricopeptide repeat protein 12 isoform X2 n=1 Tax=Melanerpes formicivorus TaxID=211600 RepID=UPI00358E1A7F
MSKKPAGRKPAEWLWTEQSSTPGPLTLQEQWMQAFLAALEKDAKERAQQRKRNELLAKALQEKGNEAFRKGDYATAVQRYTAGLEKLRDKQELYTNRAQAYLRMHEYEKAIADCEWALKCNGKCAKAFFLMGKAHLALQHYSQSRQCYEQLLQADPQRQSLFEDCVNEVNLEEKRLKAEERAKEEAESGSLAALAIKELLQNLHRPGQSILYYAGGIRLLAGAVTGCTEQTFFRTNNGFSLLRANEAVRRGFCAERRGSAELELSVSLLLLWQAVCTGNEANQHLLLSDPDVNAQLPKLLSSGVAEIQQQTLALLSLYSGNETGRRLLGKHLDLSNWLQALMSCVPYSDTRAGSAMDILSELAAGARFRSQAGALLPSGVLPLFTQLLASAKLVNQAALARCVGSLGTLCAAVGIRVQLAESRQCWQACLQLLDQYLSNPSLSQECVCAVLGLMMNLLLESNLLIQGLAVEISGRSLCLLGDKAGGIVTRACGVLSRSLAAASSAVEAAVRGGVVKKMIQVLRAGGELSSSYALRTLCICTRSSRQAQEDLVRADRGLRLLLELLASEDEVAVGNAALCLGQCLAVPGAASSLLGSGAVPALLRLAGGDAAPASVQRNSALALGRLCLAEPRHLLQLRQLNGLAILHSCLKHLQSS